MKLTTILMLVCCMQISAKSSSQNITLKVRDVPLTRVFQEIKKQTGYTFIYTSSMLREAKRVSITVSNSTLQEVLALCFTGQPFSYQIINKTVVVEVRPAGPLPTAASSLTLTPVSPPLPPPVEVKGRVTDENGNPLAGVSVTLKGSKTVGTTTNENGEYSLTLENRGGVLVFSSVGHLPKEVPINGRAIINETLQISTSSMEDVVVVGYGTTTKKDLTGSVSQVNTGQLESAPVYDIGEALKGHSSGVQVTNNSGAPGGRIQVTIRGGNSMIGSNTPLYVVDGFPVAGGIDFLNPSDIESINILKDASATAIYGSRGANGVVIITSKRGKKGQKGLISISSYYGRQEVAKRYKVLNAKQYATVANEWLKNSNLSPYFDVDTVKNPGTDWQDVIFRVAPIQNHTITFSGSSEKTRYSLSGNYYGQEGIIMNSGIKRGSFRLNLDHDLKRWLTLGVNFNASRSEQFSVPVDNGSRGILYLQEHSLRPPLHQFMMLTGKLIVSKHSILLLIQQI